ncbi:MAG: hypothetical protein GW763_07520 [Paraglaciecola sp.]|nr:hypothetical protein [Paraglaciecola sp.]NCT47827.1 hypothetical protein [Paraglaciecola sp.]
MKLENIKLAALLWLAPWLIRFKKLTHASYSVAEINQLITPHLPAHFPIAVPKGQGTVTLISAEVSIPLNASLLHAQVVGALDIQYLGNPIYRAHILVFITALPYYDCEEKTVCLKTPSISEIRLVNDEYALLKDSASLLKLFVPSQVRSLVSGTVKTALSMLTGGTSTEMNDYLQIYLDGSKQRILDYHKPQLEKLITRLAAGDDISYRLDESNWQEKLFALHGKTVAVEEGELRFKF